ncbi:MAG: hypothetical protein HY040_26095 [Planctomycetes bacterium]|nr:hypothetical protein [Planctomycetota bacterium]
MWLHCMGASKNLKAATSCRIPKLAWHDAWHYNGPMLQSLWRWLGPIVVALSLCGPALGQGPQTQPKIPGQPSAQPESRVTVTEHALAFMGTVLILLILCMPSRKG